MNIGSLGAAGCRASHLKYGDYLKYRADIDGLRALAVLAVVGYHVSPDNVPGGFVGVDIFFVISGFLISTILLSRLASGTFSFVDFYSRRIRRIFPALILVLIAVYGLGWLALSADEYKLVGKHVAGGAGFVSNLVLWRESGYFDMTAEAKPLLHLWSLGIEEQFYIVWPLLLWACWKTRLNQLAAIIAIGVISFSLNVASVYRDPITAFFSPQTRFWELMLGSALAYATLRAQQPRSGAALWLPNALSLAGAGLIAIGIWFITKADAFPGWLALLPTGGTVLILVAGAQAWLNRVALSDRRLVWFGKISYPLYLWHWPLLWFSRVLVNPEGRTYIDASRTMRGTAVLVSMALAWLTYKHVESPIRVAGRGTLKTLVLITSMVVVGVVGLDCYRRDGIESRVHNGAKTRHPGWTKMEADHYRDLPAYPPALFRNVMPATGGDIFLVSPTTAHQVEIGVAGDSHAWLLYSGLVRTTARSVMVAGRTMCPPFLNVEVERPDRRTAQPPCQPLVNNYLSYLKSDPNIRLVVLNAFYSQYNRDVRMTSDGRPIGIADALGRTVRYLADSAKVILVSLDVPEVPRSCYRRAFPVWRLSQHGDCTVDRETHVAGNNELISVVAAIQKDYANVLLYDPARLLCDAHRCGEVDDHDVLYHVDGNHLNQHGSGLVGADLSAFLDRVLSNRERFAS